MSTATSATVAVLLSLPGVGIGTVSTAPTVVDTPGLYSSWVKLPATKVSPSSRTQTSARELASMTGWSQRKLAKLLGITHPTVKALVEGRSTGSSSDTATRVIEAHSVVRRVYLLVGSDAVETARLLGASPAPGKHTPAELIAEGRSTEGLLAALDVLNPPRPELSMMSGLWPSTSGVDTHDPSES